MSVGASVVYGRSTNARLQFCKLLQDCKTIRTVAVSSAYVHASHSKTMLRQMADTLIAGLEILRMPKLLVQLPLKNLGFPVSAAVPSLRGLMLS